MSDIDARIATIAAKQHALITHAQALSAGATPAVIKYRCRTGRWRRVHRGTYLVAGAPFTWETRVHAAVLAAGSGALASHRTASVLRDLDDFRPGPVELTVSRHRKPEQLPARVHESTDLDLARPIRRRGIPTTGLLRTLLDIGCLVPFDTLEGAVEQVLRENRQRLARSVRRPRSPCPPGTQRLRALPSEPR